MTRESFRGTIEEMFKVSRVRSIDFGAENLGQFILRPIAHLAEQRAVVATEGYEQEKETTVIVSIAPPGSGKSHWLTRIGDSLDVVIPEIEKHTQLPIKRAILKWERAEDEARARGEVDTPVDQPYELVERVRIDKRAQQMMDRLLDGKLDLIELELPADATTRIDNIPDIPREQIELFNVERYDDWIGRFLGSELLYMLTRHEGIFQNKRYRVFIFGLKAGDLLNAYVMFSRKEIKDARSFEEVCYVARKWGLPVPKNQQEAECLQREGASPDTILTIKDMRVNLLSLLCANRSLSLGRNDSFLLGKAPSYIRGVLADPKHGGILRQVESALLVKIFRDDLGIASEDACIILNDPEPHNFPVDFSFTPPGGTYTPEEEMRIREWKRLADLQLRLGEFKNQGTQGKAS